MVFDDLRINGKTGQEENLQDENVTSTIRKGVRNFFLKNKGKEEIDDDPEYIEANLHKTAAEENVNNLKNEVSEPVVNKAVTPQDTSFSDNLFNIEEEKKEAKKRAVLNLEHTMAAEEDNYEYKEVSKNLDIDKIISYVSNFESENPHFIKANYIKKIEVEK